MANSFQASKQSSNSPWSLNSCAAQVEAKIDEILSGEFASGDLVAAMRYSTLGAGKKIRPFLLLKFAEILGTNPAACLNFAAAIEMIHSYSLIHDDLPAMDDDDFRRGKPSCHKKFDEATAILAGDALLTLAFEVASRPQKEVSADSQLEIIALMAKNSGVNGMVGGQMLDLKAAKTSQAISPAEILKIHHLKTGKMFIAAAEIGAILGKADNAQRQAAVGFASNFGIAFQLRDDLDDFENDGQNKSTKLQKRPKQDEQNGSFTPDASLNLASLIGFDESLKMLEEFKNEAAKNLQIFGKKAAGLEELLEF